ncbi:MAG: hypothetical protein GY928_25420 [Colwellia sp.]|nr:hypothetical protein [Colwellia sp.]
MKLVFDLSSIPKNPTDTNAKKINLTSAKFSAIAIRVGIYSIFFTVPLWLYLVFPENGLPSTKSQLVYELLILLPLMILMPLIHELIHLISRPRQIFRSDTFLLVNYRRPIMQMNLAIIPGGKVTREGFIWMSLLPLLILTVLPFIVASTSIWSIPTFFGILPCQNLALSSIDIIQAFIVWKGMKYGEVLSYGNEK